MDIGETEKVIEVLPETEPMKVPEPEKVPEREVEKVGS